MAATYSLVHLKDGALGVELEDPLHAATGDRRSEQQEVVKQEGVELPPWPQLQSTSAVVGLSVTQFYTAFGAFCDVHCTCTQWGRERDSQAIYKGVQEVD